MTVLDYMEGYDSLSSKISHNQEALLFNCVVHSLCTLRYHTTPCATVSMSVIGVTWGN